MRDLSAIAKFLLLTMLNYLLHNPRPDFSVHRNSL